MNVKKAFDLVPDDQKLEIGRDGEMFAALKWDSPEGSGSEKGPLLVLVVRDIAIEVDVDGGFKSWFPCSSDGYSPYFKKSKGSNKEQIKSLIKQLTDRI